MKKKEAKTSKKKTEIIPSIKPAPKERRLEKGYNMAEDWIQKNRITEVECIFPDLTGSAKGKLVPAHKYLKDRGFRLPESIFFQTVTGDTADFEDLIEPTEIDMILKPDLDTICFVPWATEPTAQIIHDCLQYDGKDIEFAPRNVLKRVLSYYHENGWEPIVAPEMEFYLTQVEPSHHNPLRPPVGRFQRPETGGNAYSMDTLNEFDPLLEMLYQYCEQQDLDVDTLNHEYGTAQMEINFQHGKALSLADQVFHFKRTTREVAIRKNIYATFMAKPMEDQPGSAMHVHHSVIDKKTGKNIFVDEQGNYSNAFYHFIGGLQKYIPAAMAFFAPNVNSYRRFTPDESAPVNVEWGVDNRTACIRVPISSSQSVRIENRIAGSDTNPYIVFAASLAAGYLGMMEQIKPSSPIDVSAHLLPSDIPRNMEEALKELDIVNSMHNILGRKFIKVYKTVKAHELETFSKVISSWERQYLLLAV